MCVFLTEASLYLFSENFVCFDGSAIVSFDNINDNYCDCLDGSDEPGLSLYCTYIVFIMYIIVVIIFASI